MREQGFSINGGLTDMCHTAHVSYDDAKTSVTENNRTNAWNVNGDGNTNGNNKYNRNNCVAVAAFAERFREGVWEAYRQCCHGKRTGKQYIDYIPEAQTDVPCLADELLSLSWHPSTSRCFLVTKPKLRECFAAAFRDRIIHHWIIIRMLPLFERRCEDLGNVSHACRKGYGTQSAIRQLSENMCRVSHGYTREAWVYHGDIVGFFMNIDQHKLWRMLRDLIEREYHGEDKHILLYAVETCVMHRPEQDCEVVTDISKWDELPRNKSMFHGDKNKGEAIGNLTTQHFAGYYLSFLDAFVLWLFRERTFGYTRSVDDFGIVCDDKAFLKRAVKDIDRWLGTTLGLRTHMESVYLQRASHGVRFLGQWIKPHRTYIINRTRDNFLKTFRTLCEDTRRGLTLVDVQRYESSINAMLGILRQARTYSIRRRMIEMADASFYKYFTIIGMTRIRARREYRLIA